MMHVTTEGHKVLVNAIVEKFATVHLYTDDGELEGYGYKPKQLTSEAWSLSGRYPELAWEFEAGEPKQVKGYYLADANGDILISEDFKINPDVDDNYMLGNKGSRIRVNIRLSLIGVEE